MTKHLMPVTLAGTLALAVSVAAQTPPPSSTPPPTQPPAAGTAATVTIEGCLMREDDVPGRKPNIAERVGVGEDYILTSTKMVKGSAPSAAATGGAVGTSGTSGAMYDVEGLDDETLKRHLNRRVQVDGMFENLDAKGTELIEIRATAIRAATGECPPK